MIDRQQKNAPLYAILILILTQSLVINWSSKLFLPQITA